MANSERSYVLDFAVVELILRLGVNARLIHAFIPRAVRSTA